MLDRAKPTVTNDTGIDSQVDPFGQGAEFSFLLSHRQDYSTPFCCLMPQLLANALGRVPLGEHDEDFELALSHAF